jgi:hypothetical protein
MNQPFLKWVSAVLFVFVGSAAILTKKVARVGHVLVEGTAAQGLGVLMLGFGLAVLVSCIRGSRESG